MICGKFQLFPARFVFVLRISVKTVEFSILFIKIYGSTKRLTLLVRNTPRMCMAHEKNLKYKNIFIGGLVRIFVILTRIADSAVRSVSMETGPMKLKPYDLFKHPLSLKSP